MQPEACYIGVVIKDAAYSVCKGVVLGGIGPIRFARTLIKFSGAILDLSLSHMAEAAHPLTSHITSM